jgi:hypothetical protein
MNTTQWQKEKGRESHKVICKSNKYMYTTQWQKEKGRDSHKLICKSNKYIKLRTVSLSYPYQYTVSNMRMRKQENFVSFQVMKTYS